jgi:hypothetical protein
MPSPPRLTQRRLCLAGLLLVAAALACVAIVLLLAARVPPSPARMAYERIQVGMTPREVDAILGPWELGRAGDAFCYLMPSEPKRPKDSLIFVYFDRDKRVMRKELKSADPHTLGRPIDQLLRRMGLR